MTNDDIITLLAPLLMRRLTPAERVNARKAQAGPGRTPSRFVRIETETTRGDTPRLRLYIGRGLWYEIGSPARIDVQRVGGSVWLRPARGDAGYAVTAGSGMPRCYVDGARDLLRLDDGKYSAEVRDGAIVLGSRTPE